MLAVFFFLLNAPRSLLIAYNAPDMSLFGILNVNKPSGCSSRDVVDRVERLVRPAKAGHAGTLDPLATGVLVICVGQATRLIEYVQRMPKRYRSVFMLGQRSETDDTEGEVIEVPDAPVPSRATLESAIEGFVGEIEQRPPAYSAVKIGGRRAYKLARAGKTVQLAARPVTIHNLTIARYDYPELELDIECGSGTYVRSLGRDIAAAVGTHAVMTKLDRVAIGPFDVNEAIKIDELSAESLQHHLQPAAVALVAMPRVTLSEQQLNEIRHGRAVPTGDVRIEGSTAASEYAALDSMGELVAILFEKKPGQLWPARNFF
jgi:tRNA pseudouridine55 synthase